MIGYDASMLPQIMGQCIGVLGHRSGDSQYRMGKTDGDEFIPNLSVYDEIFIEFSKLSIQGQDYK